jgi:hypothetical protein
MSLQGSLSTLSVSDLLQFLAVGRKTGLLKFSQQKVLKGIRNQRSEVRKQRSEVRGQRSEKRALPHSLGNAPAGQAARPHIGHSTELYIELAPR